jgi:hypothetical protein
MRDARFIIKLLRDLQEQALFQMNSEFPPCLTLWEEHLWQQLLKP